MAPRESARPSATILNFPGRPLPPKDRILRLSAEHDGLCVLYSHHALSRQKLFAIKILCWGLQEDGQVVALFPWLKGISRCADLTQATTGKWEGYYDPATECIFHEPPEHKALELQAAAKFFRSTDRDPDTALQELPDHIGSHAVMVDGEQQLSLHEVLSWRLLASGDIQAMLPDISRQSSSPVLPGDQCLYAAQREPEFRYFFQYHIANQIKSGDPVAVRALSRLLGE